MVSSPENMRLPNVMDNDACLYYILNGQGEIFSPTEKVTIAPKESVLMKCGSYIGCFVGASPTNPHESIGFHFHPDVVQKLVEGGKLTFPKSRMKSESQTVHFTGSPELEMYIQGMLFYLDNPSLVTEELIELKVQELLLILIKEGDSHPLVTDLLSRLYKREEFEFNRVIESNLYNNLSVPELAILTNRSESTFKRDFKKYYGDSPARYFRHKRLEKAAHLLQSTELPINEVAWDCGFESAAHFSKAFHDSYSLWPRDYRLSQIGNS